MDSFTAHQCADFLKLGNNQLVDFVNMLPCKFSRAGGIDSVFVDKIKRSNTVGPTYIEVIDTVVRRSMHGASTGIRSHMITEDDRHFAIDEGVFERLLVECLAQRGRQHFVVAAAVTRHDPLDHIFGDNNKLASAPEVAAHERIVQLCIEANRLIRRQRPRRCGPNDHAELAFGLFGREDRQ